MATLVEREHPYSVFQERPETIDEPEGHFPQYDDLARFTAACLAIMRDASKSFAQPSEVGYDVRNEQPWNQAPLIDARLKIVGVQYELRLITLLNTGYLLAFDDETLPSLAMLPATPRQDFFEQTDTILHIGESDRRIPVQITSNRLLKPLEVQNSKDILLMGYDEWLTQRDDSKELFEALEFMTEKQALPVVGSDHHEVLLNWYKDVVDDLHTALEQPDGILLANRRSKRQRQRRRLYKNDRPLQTVA